MENEGYNMERSDNSTLVPDDFMFELSPEEFNNFRSQIGTSSWGGARYVPMAFTEHVDQILVIFEYLKKLDQAKHQMLEQQNRKRLGFKRMDEY